MTNEHIIGVLGGFVLGYFIARMDFLYVVLRKLHGDAGGGLTLESRAQPTSFFAKEKQAQARAAVQEKIGQIEIDTSKFVTEIRTDNIQKVNDAELGHKTTKQDTINNSVAKLAQLKGK